MKKYLLLYIPALACAAQTVSAQSQVGDARKSKELPMPYPDKLVKPASNLIIQAHIPDIKKPFVASLPDLQEFVNAAKARCASQQNATLVLNAERANNFTADLKWETKYAFKASGFSIERSLDDTLHFTTINFAWPATGAGIKKKYHLPDRNDYSGVSFYRVKQINSNAVYSYSNIASVKGFDAVPFKIYPSPASTRIQVEVISKQDGNATIMLYDAAGKMIQQQSLICTKDVRSLQSFDVNKFAAGMYQVKMFMPDKTVLAGRFTKQ